MKNHGKSQSRQQRFAEEYIIDLNATSAARRAGYTGSEHAIEVAGSRLLRNAEVAAEIERLKAERSERTKIEADTVIRELSHVAFLDIRAAFRPDGTLLQVHEMPDGVARALAVCDVRESVSNRKRIGSVTKLRFLSKIAALELLGKHIGMFTDRHEMREIGHDQMDDVPLKVIQARIAELRARQGKAQRPTQQVPPATHGPR